MLLDYFKTHLEASLLLYVRDSVGSDRTLPFYGIGSPDAPISSPPAFFALCECV